MSRSSSRSLPKFEILQNMELQEQKIKKMAEKQKRAEQEAEKKALMRVYKLKEP